MGSLSTGAGLDNIDYAEENQSLYAAASDAARLTIARIDDEGKPASIVRIETTKGARSVVAGPSGSAYLIDPVGGSMLKVEPRGRP